jgi:Protein of unknown function (DUF3179)
MLWEGSLVMVDTETESLWSHLLGRAMRGPLEGEELETIPSLMTDWENWKSRYPETTVISMARTADRYRRQLIRHDGGLDIGLATDTEARVWTFHALNDERVINDRFAEMAIVIVYDAASRTATIYDRNVNGNELTFESREGTLVDRDTGSQWDLFTGVALSGTLEGRRLKRLPGLVTNSAAWHVYHPATTAWSESDGK